MPYLVKIKFGTERTALSEIIFSIFVIKNSNTILTK